MRRMDLVKKKQEGLIVRKSKNDLLFWAFIGIFALSLIVIAIIIYLMFFRAPRFDLKEVAYDLRGTIVSLAIEDESQLSDFRGLMYVPNMVSLNPCEANGEYEAFNDGLPWARRWLLLAIFDSLYYEITGDINSQKHSELLVNGLYNQFGSDVQDGDAAELESVEILGYEATCSVFWVLKTLESESSFVRYPKTLDLSERLCSDFYSLENMSNMVCSGSSSCLTDEQLYSKLEELFLEERDVVEPDIRFVILDSFITDGLILSYENDFDASLAYLNGMIFDFAEAKKGNIDFLLEFNPCKYIPKYEEDLLKILSLKKNYIKDSGILERHKRLEQEVLNLCSDYERVEVAIEMNQKRYSLGDELEMSFFLNGNFEEVRGSGLIEDTLANDLFYMDKAFLNKNLSNSENCVDSDIDFSKDLKTALYLLIYSAYED